MGKAMQESGCATVDLITTHLSFSLIYTISVLSALGGHGNEMF